MGAPPPSERVAGLKVQADANQAEIVSALRAAGAVVVWVKGVVQPGIPDLLVGFKGRTYLLEVKGPRGRLKPEQVKFREDWTGDVAVTVTTVAEALAVVGLGS